MSLNVYHDYMNPSLDQSIDSWIKSAWVKHPKHKGAEDDYVVTDEMQYPGAVTGFFQVEIDGVPTTFSVKVRKVE